MDMLNPGGSLEHSISGLIHTLARSSVAITADEHGLSSDLVSVNLAETGLGYLKSQELPRDVMLRCASWSILAAAKYVSPAIDPCFKKSIFNDIIAASSEIFSLLTPYGAMHRFYNGLRQTPSMVHEWEIQVASNTLLALATAIENAGKRSTTASDLKKLLKDSVVELCDDKEGAAFMQSEVTHWAKLNNISGTARDRVLAQIPKRLLTAES